MPITDISGRHYLLFTRAAKVQNHIQEGLDFGTEDYFWVEHSIRVSLVLGGSHE